jgi:trehalose 6-phosphate phosphatase
MRYLFALENSELLARLAWSNVLLAFDFDGTLAPLVDARDAARMRDRTGRLFASACQLYPCAVISGRSRQDVFSRLNGATPKYIVGNHGLEPSSKLADFAREVAAARALLERSLVSCAGVDLEDKRYSLSLHYRKSPHKGAARRAILAAISALPAAMRVVPGKFVLNLVPSHAPDKGDALVDLRTIEHADTALFVGDDVTDEAVFRLDQPGRLVTVRVGRAKSSAAMYFLRDQKEIDRLLARLVELREQVAPRSRNEA